MSFSKEILNRAFDIVNKRKSENELKYQSQLAKAHTDHPELSVWENQLASYGCKIPLAALKGDTAELADLEKKCSELETEKKLLLSSCGIGEAPLYTCPKCCDSGYANGKICGCVIAEAKKICYTQLSKNLPIMDCRFENFDLSYYDSAVVKNGYSPKRVVENTVKICKNFISDFPKGENLLFLGNCGLGKTHLSLAVVNEIIEKGYGAVYASAQNLMDEMSKETFDRTGKSDSTDSVLSCDLLVLDDLGTEFTNNLTISLIYNIINTRIQKNLSTIISTNLTIEEISLKYGQSVASRIVGNYRMREFIGTDIRKQKAKQK